MIDIGKTEKNNTKFPTLLVGYDDVDPAAEAEYQHQKKLSEKKNNMGVAKNNV